MRANSHAPDAASTIEGEVRAAVGELYDLARKRADETGEAQPLIVKYLFRLRCEGDRQVKSIHELTSEEALTILAVLKEMRLSPRISPQGNFPAIVATVKPSKWVRASRLQERRLPPLPPDLEVPEHDELREKTFARLECLVMNCRRYSINPQRLAQWWLAEKGSLPDDHARQMITLNVLQSWFFALVRGGTIPISKSIKGTSGEISAKRFVTAFQEVADRKAERVIGVGTRFLVKHLKYDESIAGLILLRAVRPRRTISNLPAYRGLQAQYKAHPCVGEFIRSVERLRLEERRAEKSSLTQGPPQVLRARTQLVGPTYEKAINSLQATISRGALRLAYNLYQQDEKKGPRFVKVQEAESPEDPSRNEFDMTLVEIIRRCGGTTVVKTPPNGVAMICIVVDGSFEPDSFIEKFGTLVTETAEALDFLAVAEEDDRTTPEMPPEHSSQE